MSQTGQTATMRWVLDDLVKRVDGIRQAVVLSRDGLTPADADHGLIAYEMAMLVKRLGTYLSANPRAATTLSAEWLSE